MIDPPEIPADVTAVYVHVHDDDADQLKRLLSAMLTVNGIHHHGPWTHPARQLIAHDGDLALDDGAARQARIAAHMAEVVHWVYEPGHKRVLCGALADDVPHGWLGPAREYLDRRIARGGAVCPDCLTALEHRTEQLGLPL